MAQSRVAVLGAGSWGTALAIVLARNGAGTTLWGRDAAAIDAMAATRRNQRYLPDAELPASLALTASLKAAVEGAELLLIVTPSHAFAEIARELAALSRPAGVAWATKGF